MSGQSPLLTRAAWRLNEALQMLDQAITDRHLIQKRLDESWKRMTVTLKALERRWDQADYRNFAKSNARHAILHQRLVKATQTCATTRAAYQDALKQFEIARNDKTAADIEEQTAIKRMYQRQGALARSLDSLFGSVTTSTTKATGYQPIDGAYDYIPLDIPGFLTLLINLDRLLSEDADYLHDTNRYRPVSFLEVGAGTGRNLVLAKSSNLVLFEGVFGFDINPDLIKVGQHRLDLHDSLQVADALTFDYSPYDVVYSYRPMQDGELQAQLEAHMARSMRLNAYLLAPAAYDLGLCPELTPLAGSPDIWKKTSQSAPI